MLGRYGADFLAGHLLCKAPLRFWNMNSSMPIWCSLQSTWNALSIVVAWGSALQPITHDGLWGSGVMIFTW